MVVTDFSFKLPPVVSWKMLFDMLNVIIMLVQFACALSTRPCQV